MRTSYLAQIVNLAASALLLLLVLAYLTPGQYLQWILFQTFAGALVQLEQSIGIVTTRFLARARGVADPGVIARAAGAVRTFYRGFALIGGTTMLFVGMIYLGSVAAGRFDRSWPIAWAVFAFGYMIWYSATWRGGLLIASDRPALLARISIATRGSNALFAVCALLSGAAIIGLAASTLAAFALGAGLFVWVTRAAPIARAGSADPPLMFRHILFHASYVLIAYLLYRAGLMYSAATSTDIGRQTGFGLLLQIMSLTTMIATVPLTMRVAPLVSAASDGDTEAVRRELGHLAAYVNIVFVAAVIGLALFAGPIRIVLPARAASLPQAIEILALGLAFWIELNLLVLINALLAVKDFRFVALYAVSALLAVAVALIAHLAGEPFYVAFVLLPAAVQAMIAAPLLLGLLTRSLGIAPAAYFTAIGAHLMRIIRHPIRVGLALR